MLTRDNLKKRNCPGNPACSFCDQLETANHLFFGCSNAKVVWGTIGSVLGTGTCPTSLWQCVSWFHRFFARGRKFHMLLIAATCWAIWNIRNGITFEKKVVRSPIVTIFSMCAFLHFLAGLYSGEDRDRIKEGADQLMVRASQLAA